MTPGPVLIMKAPGCKKPVKFRTIVSGNTFWAIFWTDGKREAPMLPDEPWLKKSPSEGVLFWSDECEEIGQINWFSGSKANPDWEDLEFAAEPTEQDYFAAITNGTASTDEKLRYLRMRLWWKGNDPVRRNESSQLPDEHLDNLRKLSDILSESDADQRLIKAEALRELSCFEDSLRLLDHSFPDAYQQAVTRIRGLAESHDCKVAAINNRAGQ
jgi:hypothetical protein